MRFIGLDVHRDWCDGRRDQWSAAPTCTSWLVTPWPTCMTITPFRSVGISALRWRKSVCRPLEECSRIYPENREPSRSGASGSPPRYRSDSSLERPSGTPAARNDVRTVASTARGPPNREAAVSHQRLNRRANEPNWTANSNLSSLIADWTA